MADGDGVEKRGDRAARHGPVEPVQRFLRCRHVEQPDAAQGRPERDGHKSGGTDDPDTQGPSEAMAPKAAAASATKTSDQSGQKARVARSATIPARVNRRGQARRSSASSW
jgi:hypothetical protein